MKLKATIEEAMEIARKNICELDDIEDKDIEQHEEEAYWQGVREALTWVLEKRETGLNDFVSYM